MTMVFGYTWEELTSMIGIRTFSHRLRLMNGFGGAVDSRLVFSRKS